MTSPLTAIAQGVALLLTGAGVGEYAPSTQPVGTLPLITIVDMPDTPDRVITLTPYDRSSNGGLTDSIVHLQVRVRGDRAPLTAVALLDQVYVALHGRRRTSLGGQLCSQIAWRNMVPLGPDSLRRYEWTSTYDVYTNVYAAGVID